MCYTYTLFTTHHKRQYHHKSAYLPAACWDKRHMALQLRPRSPSCLLHMAGNAQHSYSTSKLSRGSRQLLQLWQTAMKLLHQHTV